MIKRKEQQKMKTEKNPNKGLKLKDQEINRAGLIGCATLFLASYLAVPFIAENLKNKEIKTQEIEIEEEISLFSQIENLLYEPTTSVEELQENILSTLEEYQESYGKISGYEDTVVYVMLQGLNRCVENKTSLEEAKSLIYQCIIDLEILEDKTQGGDKEAIKRHLGLLPKDV